MEILKTTFKCSFCLYEFIYKHFDSVLDNIKTCPECGSENLNETTTRTCVDE